MVFSHPKLVASFSRKSDGNTSLYYGNTKSSFSNRRKFLDNLGVDYRKIICAKQIHASKIEYVKESDCGKGAVAIDTSIPDTDALITSSTGVALTIFTADCLSIFIYDPVTKAIGLVHAGWRGTKGGIVKKTVLEMQKVFGTNPCDLQVGFGPAMRKCSYEVGPEFCDFFPGFVSKNKDKCYFDIIGANKKQLFFLGVKEGSIDDSSICTYCRNEEFFSYRKEKDKAGRMMSVLMMR